MKNKFLVLILSIVLLSCEKNNSDDLLTKYTWILDNGLFSIMNESVSFRTDKTYIIESKISTPRSNDYVSGTISGNWSRLDSEIIFINSYVDLPYDTSYVNVIPSETGTPIGSFYGYIVSGIYQNDSSLIDSTGSICFEDINSSDVFLNEELKQREWTIIKLTVDSLIVNSDGKIFKYYSE